MLTTVLVWCLISYGLTNIVVYGSIFQPMRDTIRQWSLIDNGSSFFWKFVDGVVNCPMCFSTWAGFFLGFFLYSPTAELFYLWGVWSWFFDGLLSSGAVWAINAIVEWFEENRKQN